MSPLFGGSPPPRHDDDEISLLRVVNAVLRGRTIIMVLALALAGGVAVDALLAPRTYSSVARFFPQGRQAASGVSSLASQFGLSIPTGDVTQSPQFYAELLVSRPLLGRIVDRQYTLPTDSGTITTTLVSLHGGGEPTEPLRREAAIDALESRVQTEISPRTGVIELRVSTASAVLAQQVAAGLLEYLSEFNVQQRQSQARAERQFAEQQLDEARTEHRTAENRLLAFLQRNRDYLSSPQLRITHDRLAGAVVVEQQRVTSLAQAYERARIEEIRDTPVLTVIAEPTTPVRPDPRGLIVRTMFAAIAGVVLGVIIAVLRESFGATRGEPSQDAKEFAELRREALGDLLRPWRPITRLLRRRAAA